MKKLVFILSVAYSSITFAETSTGCGLGWQVTKSMTTSAASTRASTNATSSNTFGMTSGTSGCEKHSIVKNENFDLHFTEANFERLSAEAAFGSGEYLTSWARSQGCIDVMESEFKQTIQLNYENIFGNKQEYSQALLNLKKIISAHPKLSRFCTTNS